MGRHAAAMLRSAALRGRLGAALAQRLLGEGVAGVAKVGAIAAAAVDPQEHGVAAAVGAHAGALDLPPALGALASAGGGLQASTAGRMRRSELGGWAMTIPRTGALDPGAGNQD